jgi:SAM-dependent methyltransferase
MRDPQNPKTSILNTVLSVHASAVRIVLRAAVPRGAGANRRKIRIKMNSATSQTLSLKKFIKRIPVIGPTAARLSQLPVFARARKLAFPGSGSFWESVYREGGTSGPGSYGRLAEFKAEILNEFVQTRSIRRVIEFGCGDGAQLALAKYPEYVGVDVATASIDRCSRLFAHDPTKHFYLADALPRDLGMFDLALSLDVIYHLVEDLVFDAYMRRLFSVAQHYVVIYASNYDALTPAPHVRHRKFTTWIDKNARKWERESVVANRFPYDVNRPDETSHADFYFFTCQDQ